MCKIVQVDDDGIRRLLRAVSFGRANDVDQLLAELTPVFEIDRSSKETVFHAQLGNRNTIRLGLHCSIRLQAHAYAASVILTAIRNSRFPQMSKHERDRLCLPADQLLTWSVGVELNRASAQAGIEFKPVHELFVDLNVVPHDVLKQLSANQRRFGERIFQFSFAFVVFHELGHLKLRHKGGQGNTSVEQENDADRFAADWLLDAATNYSKNPNTKRLIALIGISTALLWRTVIDVFLGPREVRTHPRSYDRLFHLLDQYVDEARLDEYVMIWDLLANMLFIHLHSAGYEFAEIDRAHMGSDPRDEVNYLIDRISNSDRMR